MIEYTPYLRQAKTIAIVGCSGRTSRTSHTIARYLLSNGFEIVPVNPNYDEILGRTCYPELSQIPEDIHIDIINIFRNPKYAADMVRMAVEFAQARSYRPLIWTQLGVSSDAAQRLADQAELPYVKNRCIMVEHRLNLGHVTR